MSGQQPNGGSSPGLGSPDPSIPSDSSQFARIEKTAFIACMFTMLAIAFFAAFSRTFLRLKRFRRLEIDDYFLILAVLFMSASTGVVYTGRDYTYTWLNVALGKTVPPDNFAWMMRQFETLDTVATAMVWAAIFCVKFSFVLFFKKLITGVEGMRKLWWVVLVVLICAAPANMFLGFYICHDFSSELQATCENNSMVRREGIYLLVTVSIDIFTDLLVISIPLALLTRAKLSLRRKLALATVLSLSGFMILIAVVRVGFANVTSPEIQNAPGDTPRELPDTVWLFFWQQMEACVAILMVSVTAFWSMLGQQNFRSKSPAGAADIYAEKGGYRTPSPMPRARIFDRFRKQSIFNEDQLYLIDDSPLTKPDVFGRPKISNPVVSDFQPVAMAKTDQGPPVPPKSPRWANLALPPKARTYPNSPEDVSAWIREQEHKSFA